jgi:GT2 family glycosyltransferase/glycosyltransferase involved in cell wall biosynthesis
MTPAQEEYEANLIRILTGFFDPAWYAARYPDVVTAAIDPLIHFIRFGVAEKRDPNRFFDCAWYLDHYADVQACGVHPLLHYLAAGAAELRNPHPSFDAAYYVDEHPDAAANPLLYHIRVGHARGYATEKPLTIADYLPSDQPSPRPPGGLVVDVVIPVYRGLDETRRCLNAVFAAGDPCRGDVIVVDDHSPELKLAVWLDKLAGSGRIRLVRNRRNLGFVRSVNAGMDAAGQHDVVLLNSDTEVPPGWLSRLAAQAYARPRVATVSPLSNNATICGWPNNEGGPVVFGKTAAEIDAQCQTANAGRFVTTPTTVGFCMYIRREALNDAGGFDAERFGLGYGEENDFCLRATALHWQHHIACDIFVYHKGAVSFGDRAKALQKRAMARLLERHPNYTRDVARHVKLDAIGPFRFALTGALLNDSPLPVLLMVSHGLGGGVGRHIDTLVERLDGKAHVLLLASGTRGAVLSVPSLPGHPVLALPAERMDDLVAVLRHCRVQRVHVHHLLGMDLDVQALIQRLNVPFDMTVHDYFTICPQVNLLPTPTQFYCNEPGPGGCNACIAARPSHGARDILSWRAERAWQYKTADRVFCPSNDVMERMQRYGLPDRAIVVPHEPVAGTAWPLRVVSPGSGKLRIAVLGVLADHKGARTVAALAESVDSATMEIHVIGRTEDNFPKPTLKRLKITGGYDDADLSQLIETIAPHVIWFPSAAPETFSYTLSVAIDAGRPIAAVRLGSFPERLHGRPFTWLADHNTSPDGWSSLFAQVRAALPDKPVTATSVRRKPVEDFYADGYLLPAAPARAARPARTRAVAKRPLIAVIPERYDTGQPTPCAFIRLLQPLDHPAIGGGFDVLLADAQSVMAMKADIIVTQRYALTDIQAVDALAAHARKTSATLLYDLDDDLLHIAPSHPEAEVLRPKAPTIRRMVAQADAVWVSTPALAGAIRPLARDVTVIPNGLDERIWTMSPPNHPPPAGPARLFCMGTMTHDRDFALIAPALMRLKEDFGSDVEIDLIGMTASAEPLPGINRMGVPQHAGQSYPGFVDWLTSVQPGWHIGLSPLRESAFNRSKSAIKAMDYAALGLAVLASDMPVYRGSVADGPAGQLVANDSQSWYAALAWLVRNRDLRVSLAAGARQAFLASSSLAVQAEARRAAWMALLGKRRIETAA